MKLKRSVNLGLLIAFVILSLGGLSYYRAQQQRVKEEAVGRLTQMLMLRESVLAGYFESLRSEIVLWSSRSVILAVMQALNEAFERRGEAGLVEVRERPARSMNPGAVDRAPESIDERVAHFAAHHRYYDVFFINPEGDVLYSLAREADYGTNLVHGPYADTGLGRLFRSLTARTSGEGMAFEDFSRYPPSNDEPAAFLGARVQVGDELIGVYAVQIPAGPIDEIMHFSSGMGETGEIYVVGEDGLMRSNSRFFTETAILKTQVAAPTVAKALAGEVGVEIVDDYRGVPVYSAYRPFVFEGTRWAVLAEQDVEEADAPVADTLEWLLLGYLALLITTLLLRYMLLNVVLPASLAAFLGFSLIDSLDDS